MATEMFAETLDSSQHSTRLFTESTIFLKSFAMFTTASQYILP
jgi:hypothetical protein